MVTRQRIRIISDPEEIPIRRRVSYEQMEILLDFLEKNRELATGYLSTTAGRYRANQSWQAGAKILNGMGDGSIKDAKGWSAFWSNYKNKLKAKLHIVRKNTSEKRFNRTRLNDIDKRVLRLLGPTFGSDKTIVQEAPLFDEEPDTEVSISAEDLLLPIEASDTVSISDQYAAETAVSPSIPSPIYSPPAHVIPRPLPPSSSSLPPAASPDPVKMSPSPSSDDEPPPAAPSVAVPSRLRIRRRRCGPLQSALEAAQNAVRQIKRERLEEERRALRNASETAAALRRVAGALEAQAEHAAGLTAAARALADAHAKQASATQALAHAAAVALQHFVNGSSRNP